MLYLLFVLWNAADKETTVVHGHADTKESTSSYLKVIHLGHSASCILTACVRHEAVAAV